MAPLSVLMVGYATSNALPNLLRLTIRSVPASTRQVLMGGGMSGSDKKVGVVGLTLFGLRRREKVGKLGM